jgi:hypothetical protein
LALSAVVVLSAPLALLSALGHPAHAAVLTETYLAYDSQPGEFTGQGQSGRLAPPAAAFTVRGSTGWVTVNVDAGDEYWMVMLTAPEGKQLTTGVYENAVRSGDNTTGPGLWVTSSGRGCAPVTGHFTVNTLSTDTSGRVIALDADFTQYCEDLSPALTGTLKVAAPTSSPLVLTSSAPDSVQGQPVTLTARGRAGAGPVTFIDGEAVIGQASPDGAGLARLVTDRLTTGIHGLAARQGTVTSARTEQRVAAGASSLWFSSVHGDYIGLGASIGHAPPSASVIATGTAQKVTVSVRPGHVDAPLWTVEVGAPPGQSLAPGTYTNVQHPLSSTAGRARLAVSGDGRGCSAVTGTLTVSAIATTPAGTLSRLDASFTQYCDGKPHGLRGRVRYTATPLAASSTALTLGLNEAGYVTMAAQVTGTAGPATGHVDFSEGPTLLGSATLDPSGTGSASARLPQGTHSVTATYRGSPIYASSTGTAELSVPAPVSRTTRTRLTASTTGVRAGKTVTFKVTVKADGVPANGMVILHDGDRPAGTAGLSSDGTARIVWLATGKGPHRFTARYTGAPGYSTSTSPITTIRVR